MKEKKDKTAKTAKTSSKTRISSASVKLETVTFTLDNKDVFLETLNTTYAISSASAISVKRIPLTVFIDKKGNSFTAYNEAGRLCPQFIAWAFKMYTDCEGRISANEIARTWTAETGERVNPDTLRNALKPLGYKVDPARSVMGSHGAVRRNELYGHPVPNGDRKKNRKVSKKDIAGKAVTHREKEVSGDEGRRLDVTTSTAKYFFTSRKVISFEKKSSD